MLHLRIGFRSSVQRALARVWTIALNTVRPLVFATLLILVHHVALTFLMPALVYPGGQLFDNILRSQLHGGIVMIEAAVLIAVVRSRHKMDALAEDQRREIESAMAHAEQEAERAAVAASEAQARRAEAEAAVQRANSATAARGGG